MSLVYHVTGCVLRGRLAVSLRSQLFQFSLGLVLLRQQAPQLLERREMTMGTQLLNGTTCCHTQNTPILSPAQFSSTRPLQNLFGLLQLLVV